MERRLQLLHLEDNARDAEMVRDVLESGGLACDILWVDNAAAFERALEENRFDLILADYSLPGFDGMSALRVALRRRADVPFIFVSGTLGEEVAIDALKLGATDYVVKERLSRLVGAVRSALREAQHRAERAQLEERLRQAQTMQAIGRFASGIVHDFNSVLASILNNAEMLATNAAEGTPARTRADRVLVAARRGIDLVSQILAYTRSQPRSRTPTDVRAAVEEAIDIAAGALPAAVRIEAELAPEPVMVLGDATQLHQVVTNLCRNAIDAVGPQGGLVRVTLAALELPGERRVSHGIAARGAHACITVADNGCGMDGATLQRAFEPFFTTKPNGRGTGLGLAQVHAIVTQMGGSIDVQSAAGKGTAFSVYLPLVVAGETSLA